MVRFRVALCVAAVLAVPAFVRAGAWHTRLERSEPAAGSVVPAPPAIRLWFSERVELALTGLTLTGPDGHVARTVRATRADGEGSPVVVAVNQALAAGRYTVAWRTASRDGHPVKGTFAFTVTGAR